MRMNDRCPQAAATTSLRPARTPDLRIASLLVPQLPAIGVGQEFISFKNTTMESDKYICVRETGAQNTVVIVDMTNPTNPARRPITADSALMCIDKKVIALKATTPGVAGDTLQVFNLDTKQKLKAYQMPETVEFWKWITPTSLGLVTAGSVYHWDVDVGAPVVARARSCVLAGAGVMRGPGRTDDPARRRAAPPGQLSVSPPISRTPARPPAPPRRKPPAGPESWGAWAARCSSESSTMRPILQGAADAPVKVFDRTANLAGAQIISYRTSADGKWCVLIGIMPGAPER